MPQVQLANQEAMIDSRLAGFMLDVFKQNVRVGIVITLDVVSRSACNHADERIFMQGLCCIRFSLNQEAMLDSGLAGFMFDIFKNMGVLT